MDNHSYSQTLTLIPNINPTEVFSSLFFSFLYFIFYINVIKILLHDGARNRVLSQKIIKIFSVSTYQYRILFINRQVLFLFFFFHIKFISLI